MADDIRYTQERIEALVKALDYKSMRKVMRRVLRREASRMKKVAGSILRGSTIHDRRIKHVGSLVKNIRSGALRDLSGYYVSATGTPTIRKAMHKNRAGKLKPIAFWLNHGVTERSTKSHMGATGWRRGPSRFSKRGEVGRKIINRKGRATGSIEALDFIGETERRERARSAQILEAEFEKAVITITEKKLKR